MGLKRSLKIYKNVLLNIIFITNYFCFADKIHYSTWIKTDSEFPKKNFIFETILSQGLDQCIESCKSKTMCKYINFKVNADTCSLIGVANIQDETGIYDDKIEKKRGYIFGRKQDWDLGEYEECKECEDFGECKAKGQGPGIQYQNSGCGPPEEKEFATIQGNMFSIGDKAEYRCNEGYKNVLGKTGVVTCQTSGTWSEIAFKCVKAICNDLSCYLVDETERSWENGKSNCSKIGGHLAVIKSESEYEFIRNSYKEPIMWIGGRKTGEKWSWLDDTPVDAQNKAWGDNQPENNNENCMATLNDGMWHDVSCSSPYKSLCEFTI